MTLLIALAVVLLGTVGFTPGAAHAADEYTLPFIATPNAPGGAAGGAEGVMTIMVENGKSTVKLKVRGLYPDTLYTIWTAFNHMEAGMETSTNHAPPSCSANGSGGSSCPAGWAGWAGFHSEGNGVAPTAKIGSKFTDGMGFDPGATFVTNAHGDGHVTVKLDFDITSEAPVGNKDIIVQCAPIPGFTIGVNPKNNKIEQYCLDPNSKLMRVTTTWIREFIGQQPKALRQHRCANYDPDLDPDNLTPGTPQYAHANDNDTRLWQCVDPDTGLPRVARYGFDHFRLANHIDGLTHGFIGGNGVDHIIDMVGMRACAVPPLPSLTPANGVVINYTCPIAAAATTSTTKTSK